MIGGKDAWENVDKADGEFRFFSFSSSSVGREESAHGWGKREKSGEKEVSYVVALNRTGEYRAERMGWRAVQRKGLWGDNLLAKSSQHIAIHRPPVRPRAQLPNLFIPQSSALQSNTSTSATPHTPPYADILIFPAAQCPRENCDGSSAFFYQVQIRSADEPMTTFYKVRPSGFLCHVDGCGGGGDG